MKKKTTDFKVGEANVWNIWSLTYVYILMITRTADSIPPFLIQSFKFEKWMINEWVFSLYHITFKLNCKCLLHSCEFLLDATYFFSCVIFQVIWCTYCCVHNLRDSFVDESGGQTKKMLNMCKRRILFCKIFLIFFVNWACHFWWDEMT